MTLRWLSLFFSLFFLSAAFAEEDALHGTSETFSSLIKDLQQELETGKISTEENREQIYDVIGGLKMCLPVIKSVMDHKKKTDSSLPSPSPEKPEDIPQKQMDTGSTQESQNLLKNNEKPKKEEQEKSAALPPVNLPSLVNDEKKKMTQVQMINLTVEEFTVIKEELISQLNEGKIPEENREAAYTMVGTLNLCLPVIKGAALLVEEIEKEKNSQPISGSLSTEDIKKN